MNPEIVSVQGSDDRIKEGHQDARSTGQPMEAVLRPTLEKPTINKSDSRQRRHVHLGGK